jgi:hypothetical protein
MRQNLFSGEIASKLLADSPETLRQNADFSSPKKKSRSFQPLLAASLSLPFPNFSASIGQEVAIIEGYYCAALHLERTGYLTQGQIAAYNWRRNEQANYTTS